MSNNQSNPGDVNFLKAKYFYENNIAVHVNLSKGEQKFWYNGHILSINPVFFILNDKEDGEFPIFFIEVFDIKPLGKPKDESGGREDDDGRIDD